MSKILVVVDVQNDFVDGSLGTAAGQAIIPDLVASIKSHEGLVFATQDTHGPDYLETQEGRKLPVLHCQKGSEGWQIHPEVARALPPSTEIFEKGQFGSPELVDRLRQVNATDPLEKVTLVGICTDICVISNAVLIKTAFPEVPLVVESKCCAGVTPELHRAALDVMASLQIDIL